MTSFSRDFLDESIDCLRRIDTDAIDRVATGLASARDAGGRLFILGVGGSAGHASHAVNDFRKICRFEAYTPTDNVSVLIPVVSAAHITPHTEGLAAVVWHLLVSHPALKVVQTKWESMR